MGLRDIGATLPPGFRFYPSDEELVCHYLYNKICIEEGLKGTGTTLVDIDLHTCEPWQLPEAAKLNASEWFFFSFRDRKYATGFRTNRATTTGYWKATGKDKTVRDPVTREIVGMRKTLVFYRNRAPNGIKTSWIMHEFRIETPRVLPKEDWVLCRVFERTKSLEHNNSMVLDETLRPRQFHVFDSDNFSDPPINRPSISTPPPFLDLKIDNHNLVLSSPLQLPDIPLEADSSDFTFLWDSVLAEEGGQDYGVLSSSGLSCLDTLDTMDF